MTETGSALFLLDGLDEVPESGGRRRSLQEWLDAQLAMKTILRCPVVLAGRPEAFDWSLLRQCRARSLFLRNLGPDDIRAYVRGYFHADMARGRKLIAQLNASPAILNLLGSPLLLIRCLSTCVARKDRRDIDVLSCPDAIARALEEALGGTAVPNGLLSLPAHQACPSCRKPMRRESSCWRCECGYSDCNYLHLPALADLDRGSK